MAKTSPNEIPNLNADWSNDESCNLPYSGEAVQTFLKGHIRKANSRLENLEYQVSDKGLIFRFREYPSGRILVNGTLPYYFPVYVQSTIIDPEGDEQPNDATVNLQIRVTLNENVTTYNLGNVAANKLNKVNIRQYLSNGANVQLIATNEAGDTANTPFYDVVVASLVMKTVGDTWWGNTFVQGQEWYVPMNFDINVACELKATLYDAAGVIRSTVNVPGAQLTRNYNLHIPHPVENGGRSGVYHLVIELRCTQDGLDGFSTDPIEANVICRSRNDIGNYIAVNNVADGGANYANNHLFDYAVSVGYGNPTVRFESAVDDKIVGNSGEMAVQDGEIRPYFMMLEEERADDSDFIVSTAAFIEGTKSFEQDFSFTNKNGYAAASGAATILRFSGRSNSEESRAVFYNAVDGQAITPKIKGVDFTDADGYVAIPVDASTSQTVFRILAGGSVELPIKPLAMAASEGRTIELDYRVYNVTNNDTPVIQCRSGKNGLTITPTDIAIYTPSAQSHDDQNAGTDPAQRMRLTIVVRPKPEGVAESETNFSCIQLYLNGCRQRWFTYDRDLNVDANITFGSADADMDICAMRIYNKVLTDVEVEQNARNLQPTEAEKIAYRTRNNVRENGSVNFNLCRALCNVVVFDAPELPTRDWAKTDSTNATIEFYYRDEPSRNHVDEVTNLAWQGTTSHSYGTNLEYGGYGQNYKWTAVSGTKMCAKANWASSMQSHKMGLTEAFNYLSRECGILPEDATRRVAVYQEPFVAFHRKEDGSMVFCGLFTIGADKGDKGTFGVTSNSIFLEGSDNEPLGTNFLLPWNDDTVTTDEAGETYYLCGVKAWEDSTKKPALIASRWKPAFNFVYECSQFLAPWSGTVSALQTAGVNSKNAVWLTSAYGSDSQYDLFYYNPSKARWMATGINLADSLLADGRYGFSLSDLDGLSNEEKNAIFLEARRNKFTDEVAQYFDVDDAIFHNCFCEFFALKDNNSKNTYPYLLDCTSDSDRIRWRQDDVDSGLAAENQGKNYKMYCVEMTDNYADYGRDNLMVFNGTDNQFWALLRTCFAEDITIFMRTRFLPSLKYGQSAEANQAFSQFCERFLFGRAQNYFPEALYNECGQVRYGCGYMSKTNKDGNSNPYALLALSQDSGNAYYLECYWLRMRYVYMCSKYNAGAFAAGSTSDCFITRPYADPNGVGNTFVITPAVYMYPSVQNGQTIIRGERIYPASPRKYWAVTLPATQGDQEQRICGMSYIKSLGPMYDTAIRGNVDVNGKMLMQLEMGTLTDKSHIRSRITGLNVGDATALQQLTLANLPTLQGVVNLSSCINLREVFAEGTNVTSVPLCVGGSLETLHLPESLTRLLLSGKRKVTDLTIADIKNLIEIDVTNCNDYIVQKVLAILENMPKIVS